MIRLRPEAVDALLVEAMHHHVHVHVVDGGSDRETAYDAFAASFDLPEHFGRNLDALYDSLMDVATRHHGTWTLLWRPTPGSDVLEDQALLGVLGDLEHDAEQLTVAVEIARAG